jgi:hypothetical protein
MSKTLNVDLNIDVANLHPSSGLLMREVPREKDPKNPDLEFDPRGVKERTGPEVFAFVVGFAINGANPKCSYDQLKSFQRVKAALDGAAVSGVYSANKTDIDIMRGSIRGNQTWPNDGNILAVLDAIMEKIDGAKEGSTPDGPGANSK